ncbi:F-box protein [Trifolium pratense]|uniref:F-box protein n=1 Tax=Trifolium pratense TaxID=57577 RepID=A0A2K3PRU4_TRIPR|nr:F-box protein [Trifolium pratense]
MKQHHHLMLSSRGLLFYNSPISSVLSSTSTITQTQLNYPVTRNKIHELVEPYSVSTCDGIFCFVIDHRVNIMGSDYWRRIQDFPCSSPMLGPCDRPGVFVSGTVNWLTFIKEFHLDDRDSTLRAIVSLDLEKESFS